MAMNLVEQPMHVQELHSIQLDLPCYTYTPAYLKDQNMNNFFLEGNVNHIKQLKV